MKRAKPVKAWAIVYCDEISVPDIRTSRAWIAHVKTMYGINTRIARVEIREIVPKRRRK